LADRDFILWAIRRFEAEIAKRGSGSTFDSLPVDELRNFPIPLPPLETQRRIATILTEQMGAVEKARKAAEEGLEAARKLTAAHLRAVFESEEAATWKIVTIEEIADTCSGSTPLRSRKDYYNGNIPWVKTGELRDGLIENTEEHVSAVAIAETSLRLLPVNTLLIAMYGQGQTRGRTGLLAVPATTNQACFAILPNPQRFNPAFLQYWFRFSYSRLRSVSEGRGGNQPNLNGEILKAERVPLPTLETQHRIVAELNAKLEATQALIRSLEAQLEAIRALPAAILRRAFSGEL
jgi:type I restriction enzyme S subunit